MTATEQKYIEMIPSCCSRKTMQEHIDMNLCWGLIIAVELEKDVNCNHCELRKTIDRI
jgi:hypothetical protein